MALKWGKRGKEVIGSSAFAVDHQKPERISHKLEHVVAAEVKQVPLGQRTKARAKKIAAHRRFKPLVLATVIILALFAYSVFRSEPPAQVSNATDVCSTDKNTYGNIASAIKKSDTERARTIVEDILLDPRYGVDPNCKTAVIEYKLLISDTKAAEAELGQLKAIAKSETKLSDKYSIIDVHTVKDVENHVENWKKLSEQAKGNVIFSNPAR